MLLPILTATFSLIFIAIQGKLYALEVLKVKNEVRRNGHFLEQKF